MAQSGHALVRCKCLLSGVKRTLLPLQGRPDYTVCRAPDCFALDHRWRDPMSYEAINFGKKFKLFDEQCQPKVIAEMNDYQFKIAKLQGDFIWHDHKETNEPFIVLEGTLRIDFRDVAVTVQAE